MKKGTYKPFYPEREKAKREKEVKPVKILEKAIEELEEVLGGLEANIGDGKIVDKAVEQIFGQTAEQILGVTLDLDGLLKELKKDAKKR